MPFLESCASCRHWMIGSLDWDVRNEAYDRNWKAPCHTFQPREMDARTKYCSKYERPLMSRNPPIKEGDGWI